MRVAIPILALAGTAHAQAPGQTLETSPVPAGAPAPAAAAAPAPPRVTGPSAPRSDAVPTVMDDRWSIDLALWLGAANPKLDGAGGSGVGGLELAGRFRITKAIEVALALQAGGNDNDHVTMGGLVADFRYRFKPEAAWNFIALAGIGVMSVADKDTSDDMQKHGRGTLRIGGGVERRFGSWAVAATLRLYAVAQNKDAVVVTPPTVSHNLERYGVTGETLAIGASYYF